MNPFKFLYNILGWVGEEKKDDEWIQIALDFSQSSRKNEDFFGISPREEKKESRGKKEPTAALSAFFGRLKKFQGVWISRNERPL